VTNLHRLNKDQVTDTRPVSCTARSIYTTSVTNGVQHPESVFITSCYYGSTPLYGSDTLMIPVVENNGK